MKIYIENKEIDKPTHQAKRNITNVFDIEKIQSEMEELYQMQINVSPKRRWSDDIWYILLSAPYIGRVKDLTTESPQTEVRLFVDFENNTAFAMAQGGADKQAMMLLSSVANKHIKEPFKCDSSLRYNIHSLGGE